MEDFLTFKHNAKSLSFYLPEALKRCSFGRSFSLYFYRESPHTPLYTPERKEKGRTKGQSRIREATEDRTGKTQGNQSKLLGEHVGAYGEHHEGST